MRCQIHFHWRFICFGILLSCLWGCGEDPEEFDETVIVEARLDNLTLSWKGFAYGDINGTATLVVTDLNDEERTKPVNISGGTFGALAGWAVADKIWPDADPIHATFSIPDLPDTPALSFVDVELSDGGTEQGEVPSEFFEDTFDLITAGELFGNYFGGQTGFAFALGLDGQFLLKGNDIQLFLGHPTIGLGVAIGVEWLSINKR